MDRTKDFFAFLFDEFKKGNIVKGHDFKIWSSNHIEVDYKTKHLSIDYLFQTDFIAFDDNFFVQCSKHMNPYRERINFEEVDKIRRQVKQSPGFIGIAFKHNLLVFEIQELVKAGLISFINYKEMLGK